MKEFPSKPLTVRVFLSKETGKLAVRTKDVTIPFPQAVSKSITDVERKKIAESACADAVRLELAAAPKDEAKA